MICLPSIASIQLGKFHFRLQTLKIAFYSSAVTGTCKKPFSSRTSQITVVVSLIILPTADRLIRYEAEIVTCALPMTRYCNVRHSLSFGLTASCFSDNLTIQMPIHERSCSKEGGLVLNDLKKYSWS